VELLTGGIAGFGIALACKAVNATGALPPRGILAGQIQDMSFYKASFLCLWRTVATANHTAQHCMMVELLGGWFNSRKSQ